MSVFVGDVLLGVAGGGAGARWGFTDACVALLGVIVGFYWARVLRLVRKTRRATGASAQLVPAEPLGRAVRVVWYPTVVLWVGCPWLVLARPGWEYVSPLVALLFTPLVPSVGLAIALAGMGLLAAAAALGGTLVCWRRMGRSWRMGINPGERTELIVSGPYAYVAHPIYALQQALVVSSLCVMPTFAMLFVAIVEIAFLHWEAAREEKHLAAVHGPVYAAYRGRVGRFVPRVGFRSDETR